MPSQKIAIKPSPRFAVLLIIIYTTTATVLYLTFLPLPAKLALLLLITLYLIYHLARDVLLVLPNSWCAFTLLQGGFSVDIRDGASLSLRIASKTFVSPHFIVLRGKLEGRHLPLFRVIFPDALDTGVFRELCVRLRYA